MILAGSNPPEAGEYRPPPRSGSPAFIFPERLETMRQCRLIENLGVSGRELLLLVLLAALIGLVSCGGKPPPEPPPPPPDGNPTIIWRGNDQVELSWDDMPVLVYGGSEASVLRRRLAFQMHEARPIASIQTFMGFDRGDVVEADLALYDEENRVVYRRSAHLEGGVPDCYDAFATAPSLVPSARGIVLDAVCRVNGKNEVTGDLSARCHFLTTVTFGQVGPGPSCEIPGPDEPGWEGLGLPRTTRPELEAAKLAVGDRTGRDPYETLALLAEAIREAGGCALGPWVDEVAIRRADGHVDGWHAVAFSTGGYTADPIGDSWRFGAAPPPGCGVPVPGPLHHVNLKLFQTLPKRTYDATFLVGPDAGFCAAIGYTDGRAFCPVRPDGHPERDACEQLRVGAPVWTFEGEGECFARPNPYLYRCENDAHGTLEVCASRAPGVCASIAVD